MEMNAQLLPLENVIAKAGPGAAWPEIDAVRVLSELGVEVDATLNDSLYRKQELANWTTAASILQTLGVPLNPIMVGREILGLMGMRGARRRADPSRGQARCPGRAGIQGRWPAHAGTPCPERSQQ
jgi:hypothetical protein